MVEATAEYEYTAQEEDEISLQPGDVISDVNKMSGGWWEGTLNGKRGVFPDNFVKEIKKDKEQATPAAAAAAAAASKRVSHVAEMANKLGNQGIKMGPPGVGPKKPVADKKRLRARVKYTYDSSQDDELRLEVGETVDIVKQEEEGWWEGSLNGQVGMFPSNFVEIIEEDEEKPIIDGDDQSEIKGKKIKGVGLGNIFSAGPIRLRASQPKGEGSKDEAKENAHSKPLSEPKTSQARRGAPPPVPHDPPTLPPKENNKEGKTAERAKVLYSYTAENEDEVSLEEGDIITVLEKELEDSGWWKGEVHGKVGVFPDNFVELLPDEKPKKPPPPAVPPNTKAKTERVPPSEPTKDKQDGPRAAKKEEKDDKPIKTAPKKPAAPPPVGKKPAGRSTDPKLIAQTDDHKARQKDHQSEQLETVETNDKLTHPTAGRVKAPVRRPPSLKAREALDTNASSPPPPVPAGPTIAAGGATTPGEQPTSPLADEPTPKSPPVSELRKGLMRPAVPPTEQAGPKSPPVREYRKSQLRSATATTDEEPAPKSPPTSENRKSRPRPVAPPTLPSKHDAAEKPTGAEPVDVESVVDKKVSPAPVMRAPPPTPKEDGPHSPGHVHPTRGTTEEDKNDVSPAPSVRGASIESVEELKRDLQHLRQTTVSKHLYDELQREVHQLRDSMAQMKAQFNKRLVDLMSEVDEEKKTRLNTQVEIDRIKKLVTS